MAWNRVLSDLLDLFVGLYPTVADATGVTRRVGLPAPVHRFQRQRAQLLGRNPEPGKSARQGPGPDRRRSERLPEHRFPGPSRTEPTSQHLRPRSWTEGTGRGRSGLPRDLRRSWAPSRPSFRSASSRSACSGPRSVVRVVCPTGFGTGFLAGDDLLITNNHVIPDEHAARSTKIQFNYQQTSSGLGAAAEEFELAPDKGFATSPSAIGDDWTAVRVAPHATMGRPEARWGTLDLAGDTVAVGDFVKHHPAPLRAAQANRALPQRSRLRPTTPDSSISPTRCPDPRGPRSSTVNGGSWPSITAAGWLTEPGGKQAFFRNEGIHVRAIKKGLRDHGLLGP